MQRAVQAITYASLLFWSRRLFRLVGVQASFALVDRVLAAPPPFIHVPELPNGTMLVQVWYNVFVRDFKMGRNFKL